VSAKQIKSGDAEAITYVFSLLLCHSHLPATFNRKHIKLLSFHKMLKIHNIFTKHTNSREPSFCSAHFSSCRRHSITFCILLTHISSLMFYLLRAFASCGRLSPLLSFRFWIRGAARSAVIKHPAWLEGWKPCSPSFTPHTLQGR